MKIYEKYSDVSSAYTQGRMAFKSGEMRIENPFNKISVYAHSWWQGWDDEYDLLQDMKNIVVNYHKDSGGE
jgi:hypothetical protein